MEKKGLIYLSFALAFTILLTALLVSIGIIVTQHNANNNVNKTRNGVEDRHFYQFQYAKDRQLAIQQKTVSNSTKCNLYAGDFEKLARNNVQSKKAVEVTSNLYYIKAYYVSQLVSRSNIKRIADNWKQRTAFDCEKNDTEFLTLIVNVLQDMIQNTLIVNRNENNATIKKSISKVTAYLSDIATESLSVKKKLISCQKEIGRSYHPKSILPTKSDAYSTKTISILEKFNIMRKIEKLIPEIQTRFQQRAFTIKGKMKIDGLPL